MTHGFEIWRQRRGAKPERLRFVLLEKWVDFHMESYAATEKGEGGEINPSVGGFSVSSRYVVIGSDDGSGLPRSREVTVPSAHYWHEEVMTDECPIRQDVLDQLAGVTMRFAAKTRWARGLDS